VAIENPIRHETVHVKTNDRGEFAWSLDARSTEPGFYTFFCRVGDVEPSCVVVSIPSREAARYAGTTVVPLGAWESGPQDPSTHAAFALTHRSRTSAGGKAQPQHFLKISQQICRKEIQYWSQTPERIDWDRSHDAIRLSGLGRPRMFDPSGSQQLVEVDLLYDVCPGKRDACVHLVEKATRASLSTAESTVLRTLIADEATFIIAFAIDPYVGLCEWPEDFDSADRRHSSGEGCVGFDSRRLEPICRR
jgi:hypothetical protein